jgi:hypothetical protein
MQTAAALPVILRGPGRIILALSNPKHANVTAIAVLLCYGAVWTLYAVVSKSTQGIHPDMAEIAAWSTQLEWGTPKHPPLLPAIVRVWFSFLPAADWTYYLLSVTLVTAAIYFGWLIAGLFLDGIKRAIVPFFLMLIPFYNFLALKLDHNVVLIPLWAATTFCFLKAYRSQALAWALATGVCAGVAVLAKYWSFFLLAGLGVAAIAGPDRSAFFRSRAPFIIAVVSFLVFLPHILWLQDAGYPTFVYAQHRLAESTIELVQGLCSYGLFLFGYIGVPVGLLVLLEPSFRRQLASPQPFEDRETRYVAILFWAPLLASMIFAVASHTRLGATWTMSALSLAPVLALAPARVTVSLKTAACLAGLAIALSLGALFSSPVVAWSRLINGVENEALHTRELARRLDVHFDGSDAERPRYVSGRYAISHALAFYMRDRPLPLSLWPRVPARWSPGVDPDDVVTVCAESDLACREHPRVHPMAKWIPIDVDPQWHGFRGARQTFVVEQKPTVFQEGDQCCVSAGKRRATTIAP